jgi:hypothetical protein
MKKNVIIRFFSSKGCGATMLLFASLTPACRAAQAASTAPKDGLSREVAGSLANVKITDSFWAPRLETNRTVTLPHVFKRCEDTGRISNFDCAAGVSTAAHRGYRKKGCR